MTRVVKQASVRREEIIRCAKEYFQTQNFEKFTIQHLMEKLKIAKGTIYHHFASKGEILEAVVENIVDEEMIRKLELLKEHKGLKPLEKLTLLITESNIAQDNAKLLKNLHHPENVGIHSRQLARIILKVAPLYASVIREGCKEGVFKTKNPVESAELLLAGIQFLTDEGFYSWDEEQLNRRMEAFPSLIENLLVAPAGSFNFLKNN